jgi:gas vesicle protein
MATGNTFLAFVAGGAIGAIVGILYAPEKGSVTRENLRTGLDDLKTNLQDKLENATGDIKGQLSNASLDIEGTYQNLVSGISHKAEDVISYLETKLADLKRQNAKFQKDGNNGQYAE